ncbi:MAG: SURF1 family protein [Pseudomonadales bacterium]|nr:SURF1 family protein [Pseudomonadales bacterium]
MSFHFNWKLTLFVVLCLPVVISAGFWQLDRAEEKRQMQQQLSLLTQQVAIEYSQLEKNQFQNYKNITVTGQFINRVLLLDNQIFKGQFGYEVIQPFLINNNKTILVSRGWVKGDLDRRILPEVVTPGNPMQLNAYLYQPSKSLQLNAKIQEPGWPKRVQSVDMASLQIAFKNIAVNSTDYVLRLQHKSPGLFTEHWTLIPTRPEKHSAYAVQWFAMAVLLIGLFIYASCKKT